MFYHEQALNHPMTIWPLSGLAESLGHLQNYAWQQKTKKNMDTKQ